MDAYTRRNGKLTVLMQKAMAAQIEKRMVQESALYTDYKNAKLADSKEDGFEDTWLNALHRWARVIQQVRDVIAISAKYGSTTDIRRHKPNDGFLDDGRAIASGKSATKAEPKSTTRTTSSSFNTVESSTGRTFNTWEKPIAKRALEINTLDEGIFTTRTTSCNRCG